MQLGVMQGRLLPKFEGRYQAHPVGYWQEEFPIAQNLGLDLIEFILDFNDVWENPLMHTDGLAEIKILTDTTGVQVRTVCADYFMGHPIKIKSNKSESIRILSKLIENTSTLGVTDIVIPFVDESSISDEKDFENTIEVLSEVLDSLKHHDLNLSLETDLDCLEFKKLLDRLSSPNIKVNYDIGNSASLGYQIEEEFEVYGNKISDIHIKDRVLHGNSVVLGEGNSNFEKLFQLIDLYSYNGPLIFQAYRDEEGLTIFKKTTEMDER